MPSRVHLALACVVVLSAAVLAQGGQTVLGTSGWRAEWDSSLDPYVMINYDGETSDMLFIEKSAEFIQPPSLGGLFPTIPITFRQIGPSTISKIVINDEVLTNSTGVDWTDFHWDVLDSGDVWFDNSPGFFFSTMPLNNQSFSADLHRFSVDGFGLGPNGTNAVVATGSTWYPGDGSFDGELIMNVVSGTTHNTVFVLKETPTPEPGMAILLALAGLPLLRRRS